MIAPGRVAVVGGGLAGMAAALALAERGVGVDLFESRRSLGGRAGSYRDSQTGEQLDYCQHACMGCCTNLADFCERTGIARHFQRFKRIHFIGPDGERCDLVASRWLPAPLHLARSLWGLRFLSRAERWNIASAMLRLARDNANDSMTMAEWLSTRGQSPRAIELFWGVVLTSALAESLERISVAAARQIFLTGFMATRTAYHILVPTMPLGELFGTIARVRLTELGVELHAGTPVRQIDGDGQCVTGVELGDGNRLRYENVVLAVSWRHVAELLARDVRTALAIDQMDDLPASPITGIHLWFDRPIMTLPHAVLVGRLSQWVFAAEEQKSDVGGSRGGWYYQVVVSASRMIVGADRQQVIDEVCRDLRELFPAAREAQLLDWQLVTDKHAVFSPLPGIDARRPPQRTAIKGLTLAGDWTATGWPATMESAVRSGYLAAEAVLAERGTPARELVPDLPHGLLARWLFGRESGVAHAAFGA